MAKKSCSEHGCQCRARECRFKSCTECNKQFCACCVDEVSNCWECAQLLKRKRAKAQENK